MTDEQSPEAENRQTFSEKASSRILPLFQQLFDEIPELRSACVVLDWKDGLNKAIPPCIWMDEHGPMLRPRGGGDAIIGSMQQLMRTFAEMGEVGIRLIEAYDLTFQQKEQLLQQVEARLNEQSERFSALAEQGQDAARKAVGETKPPDMGQEPEHDPGSPADQ